MTDGLTMSHLKQMDVVPGCEMTCDICYPLTHLLVQFDFYPLNSWRIDSWLMTRLNWVHMLHFISQLFLQREIINKIVKTENRLWSSSFLCLFSFSVNLMRTMTLEQNSPSGPVTYTRSMGRILTHGDRAKLRGLGSAMSPKRAPGRRPERQKHFMPSESRKWLFVKSILFQCWKHTGMKGYLCGIPALVPVPC